MIIFAQKAFSLLFCTAALLMQFSCLSDSYSVQISGPASLGEEWAEFRPAAPLKAEKNFQWVVLELEPPFKYDLKREGDGPKKGQGILMPDGDVINPEIELIDQYGNVFRFVWAGAKGDAPVYDLPYPDKLPRDREYTAIRIRSPRPVKCKAIYWLCESSKDWS